MEKQRAYFEEPMWVTEKLVLQPLMMIKQDYNITLVQQFFATLVFADGDEILMT
jgi:hypothetical protein